MTDLSSYFNLLDAISPFEWVGKVVQIVGLLVESEGPAAAIGDFCEIQTNTLRTIRTQVIGFRNGRVLSMPLEDTDGLQLGDRIVARTEAARVAVGPKLLGRVLDGFGNPIDNKGPIEADDYYELFRTPPGPMEREHIRE